EQSQTIWREMNTAGNFGQDWASIYLGDVALNRGEVDLARSLYQDVVTLLREIGDINFLAYAVRRLGQLLWRNGDYGEAIALCKESLDYNQQVGSPRGVFGCLAGFAAIAIAQGRYQYAAQLMAAVETQMVSMGITPMYMDRQEYDRNLARLRTQLDEKTLTRFWAKGREMSLDQALAMVQ
ncbi:MAG: tetratricopeptide repeat protein, partial [Bacteroidota bacterium]